ncbi:hypothetical protein SFR_5418 [Streptomyces sp. FR-008]|nr:hypothetical protein SFR_5418 [Streptomyces sp. FR-008]
MLLQRVGHQRRQGYLPPFLALRQSENQLATNHLHLAPDVYPACVESDLIFRQAEDLTLTKSAPRT